MTQFLEPPAEFTAADTSSIRIIPVPYDGTSTYRKGADKGPAALIEASTQVECFDIETQTEVHIHGIHTEEPVLCHTTPEDLAPLVRARVSDALRSGRFPVVIGGEHSVTIGAIEAIAEHLGSGRFTVLQIDAHGDTRESYHGSTHNHACVMARAREHATIAQVGIRAIDKSEWDTMDRSRIVWGWEISKSKDDSWMDRVMAMLDNTVYITVDLDAFDPAYLPATGTPEPDGMTWRQVNDLVRRVCRERTVIGFDVVELCPHEAHHGSDFFAAKLVHRMLSEVFAARA
ncbi:MAG: agmatinase [Planctomycetota bacterium]|nr:MAG: agmatinase [Planctomycetota bacterium]